MQTMVQQPSDDYNIDDGVYFDIEDLKGARGSDRLAERWAGVTRAMGWSRELSCVFLGRLAQRPVA